jgi:hypothetical protein
MAAALSGAAYAHWYKIISVDGLVETGKLHLYPMIEETPLVQEEDKEVAYWGVVSYSIEGNWAQFELFNVYPCLTAELDLTIVNDGTIPAGLKEFRFIGKEYPGISWLITPLANGYHVDVFNDNPDTSYMGGITYIGGKALMAEVDVTLSASQSDDWPTNSWYQVDPGCEAYAHVKVHFDEALPMDRTFGFAFELEYWNWNEVEYPVGPT